MWKPAADAPAGTAAIVTATRHTTRMLRIEVNLRGVVRDMPSGSRTAPDRRVGETPRAIPRITKECGEATAHLATCVLSLYPFS
jgi:hypothetical protein